MQDFVCFHRILIRKVLQVKLRMLQVSVNPCYFTIFIIKKDYIFSFGKNVRRLLWKRLRKAAVMSKLICSFV